MADQQAPQRALFVPTNLGDFTYARAAVIRQQLLQHLRLTRHTQLVTIDYRMRAVHRQTGAVENRWRRARLVVPLDRPLYGAELLGALNPIIRDLLRQNFEAEHRQTMSGNWVDDQWHLDVFLDPRGEPEFAINTIQNVMALAEIRMHLGLRESDLMNAPAPLGGNALRDGNPATHSFHYLIQGCDHTTLHRLVETDDHEAAVNRGEVVCRGTCMYDMLENRNLRNGSWPKGTQCFKRENVLRFMQQRFHVRSYDDGMSADQLQAHAETYNYGHWACDIARSTLVFHRPDPNRNKATIAYVVTGTHCQPITEKAVLQSIMEVCGARHLWRRDTRDAPVENEVRAEQPLPVNKRGRRDPVGRRLESAPGRAESEWTYQTAEVEVDPLADEAEEESGGDEEDDDREAVPEKPTKRCYPTVDQTDRFHLYPKAEMMVQVEEKCRPDYWEPGPKENIHFYITTDEGDVQYIYHYLVRVLNIDPLKYARSYNGVCRLVRLNNVHWFACPGIEDLLRVHRWLCPREPFRCVSLGSYAAYMLANVYKRVGSRYGNARWVEVKSMYAPNMQRLADPAGRHKQRSCLLRRTFRPPYSDPRDGPVRTLIPMSQRRRVDLIRSYAAVLASLDPRDHEAVCIHGLSDRVVRFDTAQHHALPAGHYVVRIPTTATDDWAVWHACYPPGAEVLVTHRLLRGWVTRGLLAPEELSTVVVWVCTTNAQVQRERGPSLVASLLEWVAEVYNSEELPPAATKTMINYLVGIHNGVTLPVSGARLLFKDLPTMWQLMNHQLSRDQMRRMRVLHTVGMDNDWHRSYDYYELDCSGLRHRTHNLQPLFEMVLEQQALNVFDVCRLVPPEYRIQVHVDAVEYFVPDPRNLPMWAKRLADATVSAEEYATLTPRQLWEARLLGRFKEEFPKPEDSAVAYHYVAQKSPTPSVWERPLEDHECSDVVEDWRGAMRVVVDDVEAAWRAMVPTVPTEAEGDDDGEELTPDVGNPDMSGILITGPAGTGKTRALRQWVEWARDQQRAKVLLTAYTHAACVQMGPEAVTLSALFGINPTTPCLREWMGTPSFQHRMAQMRVDWLVVDEISLIPYAYLELLYRFHRTHPRTRIVLVGDFHQLPPIERRGGPLGLGDDYDYFASTDIFPYLVYDAVGNHPGHWLQLRTCHRTQDPILRSIAENPLSVTGIVADQFPPFPEGGEIWRFLALSNAVRKACNFYCMVRYLQKFPCHTRVHLCLRDLWAQQQLRFRDRRALGEEASPKRTRPDAEGDEESLESLRARFDAGQVGSYQPMHWQYLQDYVYAVGMPVACRQTMRTQEVSRGDVRTPSDALECVNNRRAHIVDIDTTERTVVLRWDDVATRHRACPTAFLLEAQDIELSFYDFAFHFVPAFCTTIHWAQGETIQEHYGVLEWNNVRQNPKAAYVAVTRGSASYLHLIPWATRDPWNVHSTQSVSHNVLRELYQLYCWSKVRSCRVGVEDVMARLDAQERKCARCSAEMKLTGYLDATPNRFRIRFVKPEPLSADDVEICCQACLPKPLY